MDRYMMNKMLYDLQVLNQIQKKSRTMLCIYLLLLLCGAMVVVLILKKSMGG